MGLIIFDTPKLIKNYENDFSAPPQRPFPSITQCLRNATGQSPIETCNLHNISSPIIITCSVFGYYPAITLFFRHNSSKLEKFQTREWNNTDGTRNKTITVTAEASDFPYTCVAADIHGSVNGEQVISITLYAPLQDSSTKHATTFYPSTIRGGTQQDRSIIGSY